MNKYKSLFEDKFTTTHDYTHLTFLESVYFHFSPSTVGLRRMFRIVRNYKNNKRKLKILDIGCGGGIVDLTHWGEVYGLDISESSILLAKKIYKEALVKDLSKKFPYKKNYFDIVFCSEVYGHIYLKDKENLLHETKRVLKDGGIFVFSCETQGKNWLTEYLKRRRIYKNKWIDFMGHIGLEPFHSAIKRFQREFTNVQYMVNNTYIFTVDEIATIFPVIALISSHDFIRRVCNLLLAPLYLISLTIYYLDSANDIIVYGKK